MRLGLLLLVPFLALAGETPVPHSYELQLVDPDFPERPFRVEVPPHRVDALETYLKKGLVLDSAGDMKIGIVYGDVEKVKPTEAHPWSFRIKPETVGFNDMAIELCDGTMDYVEKNLDQWMEEVGQFCPWMTRRWAVSLKKVWVK